MCQSGLVSLLIALLNTMAMAQSVAGPRAIDFDKINFCPAGQTSPKPCSRTRTMTYSISATTTFGKAMVVTQGAPHLDFTLSSTTCKGTLQAGSSCTVTARFAPLAAGTRMGAAQLLDSSGNLLVTTLLGGQGEGPTAAFNPSRQILRLSTQNCNDGFCYYAVAVDAAENVFFEANGDLVRLAPNGVQTTVASGLPQVYGLAIDGAGNVFVSCDGIGALVEISAITGARTTIGPFHSGVAVDKRGNLFVSDYNLLEIHAGTGKQTIVLPAVIDGYQFLNDPWGVAVDGKGDVFVANLDYTDVWEVPVGGLHGGFPVDAGQGGYATGVAVDAAGDLFITDAIGGEVLEYQAGNFIASLDGGQIAYPQAIAVDGSGNLFLAQPSSYSGNTLVEVKASQPATLNFGKVAVGTTSSPQSITIQNAGNQPLNAVPPGLSISAGFVQVPGSGSFPDCTPSFSLTPSEVCNLTISFAPQVGGKIRGTATFTDNALNTFPSAAQTVKLQGVGVQ